MYSLHGVVLIALSYFSQRLYPQNAVLQLVIALGHHSQLVFALSQCTHCTQSLHSVTALSYHSHKVPLSHCTQSLYSAVTVTKRYSVTALGHCTQLLRSQSALSHGTLILCIGAAFSRCAELLHSGAPLSCVTSKQYLFDHNLSTVHSYTISDIPQAN